MAKQKKNVYYNLLLKEILCGDGTDVICKAIGERYVRTSNALYWLETGQTEKTIIKMLRKLQYKIPRDVVGSDTICGAYD